MTKIIVGLFFIGILGFATYTYFHPASKPPPDTNSNATNSPTPLITPQVEAATTKKPTTSLFVPYWGLPSQQISEPDFDELIYFGVGVNSQGLDTKDPGYTQIGKFDASATHYNQRILTIRMINNKTNFDVLKNKAVQQKVISQSIAMAQEHNFQGILLDLELVSLPFASITSQMNSFVEEFHKEAHNHNLEFSLALYADTFYRIRPYDVVFLSKYADRVMLMAYDFHKSKGNPGPNFPLDGKDTYGYDFKLMVTDFLNMVPKEKLVVIFGLFGYDWTVNDSQKTEEQAQSLSYLEIKQQFVDSCKARHCTVKQDALSSETKVEYTDSDLQNHIVWFETLDSIEKKKQFLKQKGIESTSYWAYSFF